ncbi:hypothetical protein [Herbidospora solisilvae]|nr:hypothetical protein [Herbidospora solisilvae]
MRARTMLAASSPEAARAMARRQLAAGRPAVIGPGSDTAPTAGLHGGQVGSRSVASADAEALATKPTLRLVESEDVFRRQVVDRHALPTTRWASEPERDYAPDDPDTVAAELAWLISVTRPTTPDDAPDGA